MTNKSKKIIIGILSVLVFIFGSAMLYSSQTAHSADYAVSILFVGNSHVRTGNVPGQLQALAGLHGIEITYVDVSRNGQNLDGAMRENAIREMQSRNFDFVVFPAIGGSRRPLNDLDGFLDDIQLFSGIIRENGATPVLYAFGWGHVGGQPDEGFKTA